MTERAWFALSLACGHLLRGARYSRMIRSPAGDSHVRKRRAWYAPVLLRMGNALLAVLGAGLRVLFQREWEERERRIYRALYRAEVRTEAGGILLLPLLPGRTLAALLDDPDLSPSGKVEAIGMAVRALREFHDHDLTHGDAMAENVLVDLVAGVARWCDFETLHDARLPIAWRRADDLRALLATSLARMPLERLESTTRYTVEQYADRDVAGQLSRAFASAWQRALPIHLGQAPLSRRQYRAIGRMMSDLSTG